MTSLILAALLSISAHADGNVIQSLQLDLDGDGKPDLVQLVDTDAADFLSLQATLSKDGRQLRYDKLIRKWNHKTCGEFSVDTLGAGAGNSLDWFEGINTEDDMYGECRYEEKRTLHFHYAKGDLRLDSADLYSQSWGMGSPAPHVTERDDFQAGTIDLHIEENHEFHVDRKAHEKLKTGCSASMADLNAGGYPVCAALQSRYMYQETFPEDGDQPAAPTCPNLEGAFTCNVNLYGTNDFVHEQILVIHRLENKIHRYDLSNDNSLVADGKTRLVKQDSDSTTYQTTSCHRERLTTDQNEFLLLSPGDKRNPIFDKVFWDKKETVWTQLDLDGKHFSVLQKEEQLEDNGTYRALGGTTMDCVKLPEER